MVESRPAAIARVAAKRPVNAAEVVEHERERQRVAMVLEFLLNAWVRQVKRRIDMRMEYFGDRALNCAGRLSALSPDHEGTCI